MNLTTPSLISKASLAALATTTLAGAAIATLAGAASPSTKPNILFIITDQQNADMIQALSHNPYIATPGLDRLVNKGCSYTNTYVANPVCAPSRFAMFSGESTVANGIRANGQGIREKIIPLVTARSLGVLLKNSGYDTYYGGKTHLAFGSSDSKSINDTKLDNYGFTTLTTDARDLLATTGAQFLADHKSDTGKPFFLVLSFINPHDICAEVNFLKSRDERLAQLNKAAQRSPLIKAELDCLARAHDEADKKPPAFWESDDSAKLPLNMAPAKDNPVAWKRYKADAPPTDAQWRRYIWVYHRLVEVVDREIAQVLDALDKSAFKDNTIVVYTSDHGELGGSHGLTSKTILYEECQKVPFVFAGPNIRHGTDNTIVCNGWDIIPTFCDIASIPAPRELTGISLYPNMTKNTPVPPRKYLYLESSPGLQVIGDARYKYCFYDIPNPQYEMLYDLQTDPGELKNLIADPNYKPIADDLRAQLKKEAAARNITLSPKKPAAGKAKSKSKSAPKPAPIDDDE